MEIYVVVVCVVDFVGVDCVVVVKFVDCGVGVWFGVVCVLGIFD